MKYLFPVLVPVFAAALVLGGCKSILPQGAPPAKTFTLNAPVIQSAVATRRLPSVKILLPQTAPGLETERVALRTDNNRIEYYSDVRWADASNSLIQSLLVESFDNSAAFQSVSNDLLDIESDYNVLIEMRDFQIEFKDNKPYANIRFVTKLIRNSPKTIALTRTYTAREYADDNSLKSIMAAFDNAYQQVARAMIQDTITIMSQRKK